MSVLKKVKLFIVSIILLYATLFTQTGCRDIVEPPMVSFDTTGKTKIIFDTALASYMNVGIRDGSIFIYRSADGLLDTTVAESVTESWTLRDSDNLWLVGHSIVFHCSLTMDYSLRLGFYPPYDESTFTYSHEFVYHAGTSHHFSLKDEVYYSENGEDISFMDSVTIEGTTYYDILVVTASGLGYEEIWYAKGIGVIMKKSWLLDQPYKEFYLIDYEIK